MKDGRKGKRFSGIAAVTTRCSAIAKRPCCKVR